MKAYYHARAREYDDWWLAQGLYEPAPAGWAEERDRLFEIVRALPPVRTLDVACGTGFVTRLLPGEVVGLDQSETMLEMAREQAPEAELVHCEGTELPFGYSPRRGASRRSSSWRTPHCTEESSAQSGRNDY